MKGTMLLMFVLIVLSNAKMMVVNTEVANLREHQTKLLLTYEIDRDQLSQLLYNEVVLPISKENGFVYVEAIMQPYRNATTNVWSGYRGFIDERALVYVDAKPEYDVVVSSNTATIFKRSCHAGCLPVDEVIIVSMGTMFQSIGRESGWVVVVLPTGEKGWIIETSIAEIRHDVDVDSIVNTAESMLGWYYLWGGRSNFLSDLWNSKTEVTGVDCSGLVSLAYLAHGKILPRDADPIFRASTNVSHPSQLKPGDVFFYGDRNANHMTHIMLLGFHDMIIESTTSHNANGTRTISIEENFGNKLSSLQWGQQVHSSYLYWGKPHSINI